MMMMRSELAIATIAGRGVRERKEKERRG